MELSSDKITMKMEFQGKQIPVARRLVGQHDQVLFGFRQNQRNSPQHQALAGKLGISAKNTKHVTLDFANKVKLTFLHRLRC